MAKHQTLYDFIYMAKHQTFADQYEIQFDKIRQDRFVVENSIAQDLRQRGYNVAVYNSYQEYRLPLDKNTWNAQLNNIMTLPQSANRPSYSQYWSKYNIGAAKILPPITSTTSYPPPNILFSMPTIPTYSTPRMSTYTPTPTYTPTIPSSSWGRKY
jgi:hypothetical protein